MPSTTSPTAISSHLAVRQVGLDDQLRIARVGHIPEIEATRRVGGAQPRRAGPLGVQRLVGLPHGGGRGQQQQEGEKRVEKPGGSR